jgi:transcriptional regulator with XRE-family HTH domain
MVELFELGEQAKAARRAKGLTQQEVAERSGVSRARLDALENGRSSDVGFRNVVRILNALGLDLQIVPAGLSRPTLDDLMREEEGARASRLGR